MASNGTIRIDFICVRNAGRSQMAAALAEQIRDERDLDGVVEIHSAGTNPADHIDGTVVGVMEEINIDISDRRPRYVVLDDLKDSHYLITMGCSITEFNPAQFGVESRTWELRDPEGTDPETVREIRDEIETRVEQLFDEIEATVNDRTTEKSLSARVQSAVKDALSF